MTAPSASDPVLLDSSGWLEYITSDTKADLFAPYLEGDQAARPVLVPAIVLYEVRKILLQHQPKTIADLFVSEALRRTVVPVDEEIALAAAVISIQHELPMADALIFATAEKYGAELVTSDAHFKGLPRVTLI
ncbi:MAG TPA: type II toxin-antitoxin system VapC family toxin [Candidatus Acidoferrum sp.]